MRERQKATRYEAEIMREFEQRGDTAMARFAYIQAVIAFEQALTHSRIPEGDTVEHEVRLCKKLAMSLLYGSRPELAAPWFERELKLCLGTPHLRYRTPSIATTMLMGKWLESRTSEIPSLAKNIQELLVSTGRENERAYILHLNSSIATYFVSLGHYEEARQIFPLETIAFGKDPHVTMQHFHCRAILYATCGQKAESFLDFERALEMSKDLSDGYLTTIFWANYSNWATTLGRLDIARSCGERALFVARERHLAWRIPYFTLHLASTLLLAGDYTRARQLYFDAISYDTETPVLRVLRSIVGLELALALHDRDLLERSIDEKAVEMAFSSGEPRRIAPLITLHVRIAIGRGDKLRAKKLITRALTYLRRADDAEGLLAIAALYGSQRAAAQAKELLEARLILPNHLVAQAHCALWETYAALRRKTPIAASENAVRAMKLFTRLGWQHQQNYLLRLLPASNEVMPVTSSPAVDTLGIFGDLSPSLTNRERQVAELVLRGLTNRTIAETLSISQHTVESHMTSILNRLGLRSRWQLANLPHEAGKNEKLRDSGM